MIRALPTLPAALPGAATDTRAAVRAEMALCVSCRRSPSSA